MQSKSADPDQTASWEQSDLGQHCLLQHFCPKMKPSNKDCTVKILKIGTPEIITIIVLQLEQLDFTVQYCVQMMQTE